MIPSANQAVYFEIAVSMVQSIAHSLHTSTVKSILSQVIPNIAAAHKAPNGVSTIMFTSSIVDDTFINICVIISQ